MFFTANKKGVRLEDLPPEAWTIIQGKASFNWTTGSNPGGWANMMPFQSALSSGRIGNGIHYNFSEYSPGVIENRTADSAVFWERGGNYASLITLDRRVPCNVLVANPDKFYSSGGVDNHSANIRLMKLDDTSDM